MQITEVPTLYYWLQITDCWWYLHGWGRVGWGQSSIMYLLSYHIDQIITKWQNDKMTKWPNDKNGVSCQTFCRVPVDRVDPQRLLTSFFISIFISFSSFFSSFFFTLQVSFFWDVCHFSPTYFPFNFNHLYDDQSRFIASTSSTESFRYVLKNITIVEV